MKLIFDIEADNLLHEAKNVWCIVALDADTEEVHTFAPSCISDGLELLSKADELIGHNVLDYDLRLLKNYTILCTQVKLLTLWYMLERYGLTSGTRTLPL